MHRIVCNQKSVAICNDTLLVMYNTNATAFAFDCEKELH